MIWLKIAVVVIACEVVLYMIWLLIFCLWEMAELKRIRARIDEVGAFMDAARNLPHDEAIALYAIIEARHAVIKRDQEAFTNRRRLSLGVLS